MSLKDRKVKPLDSVTQALHEKAYSDWMNELPQWEVETYEGMETLVRSYTFDGYVPAVKFTNRVAELAEELQHHPQIVLEWGSVVVRYWTHVASGLHDNDFVMAAKTDALLA